ncbi:MAG: CYTH domain-containing protein [Oscillospiraceae bacterium]|nr:CYTH domain-containing protein [Oscillospiraceae bacterium]
MALEYEIKLVPTQEKYFLLLEASAQEQGRHYDMETTYYDTPDRHLRRRSMTLRRRLENGVSVCTLKTPTGSAGRNEYELEAPDIETAIPELCRMAQEQALLEILLEGVEPVCGAKFHRISRDVMLTDGKLELSLDRGVLMGGGKTQPLLEVELELKEGSPEGVIRNAQALCAAYQFKEEKRSKYARAYALAEGR